MKYPDLIRALKAMSEKQLVALFNDFEDIETVTRISDAAYKVSEEYIAPEPDETSCELKEWLDDDYTRRYRDHNNG